MNITNTGHWKKQY